MTNYSHKDAKTIRTKASCSRRTTKGETDELFIHSNIYIKPAYRAKLSDWGIGFTGRKWIRTHKKKKEKEEKENIQGTMSRKRQGTNTEYNDLSATTTFWREFCAVCNLARRFGK
jgi:hypothetical protein